MILLKVPSQRTARISCRDTARAWILDRALRIANESECPTQLRLPVDKLISTRGVAKVNFYLSHKMGGACAHEYNPKWLLGAKKTAFLPITKTYIHVSFLHHDSSS
jgi:hypothetical protein